MASTQGWQLHHLIAAFLDIHIFWAVWSSHVAPARWCRAYNPCIEPVCHAALVQLHEQNVEASQSCLHCNPLANACRVSACYCGAEHMHGRQWLSHVVKIEQDFDCGWLADRCVIHDAQAGDAHIMCHWVLHLLQTYSSYNKGRRSVQTAASLRQDAVGESYRYTAIMPLLCINCQPALADAACAHLPMGLAIESMPDKCRCHACKCLYCLPMLTHAGLLQSAMLDRKRQGLPNFLQIYTS